MKLIGTSKIFAEGKVQLPREVQARLQLKEHEHIAWLETDRDDAIVIMKREKVPIGGLSAD